MTSLSWNWSDRKSGTGRAGRPTQVTPPCSKNRFADSQILSENHPQPLACYISMWETGYPSSSPRSRRGCTSRAESTSSSFYSRSIFRASPISTKPSTRSSTGDSASGASPKWWRSSFSEATTLRVSLASSAPIQTASMNTSGRSPVRGSISVPPARRNGPFCSPST